MAVNDFKAGGFLFLILGVLLPDGNYFGILVISATFRGERISIDQGKVSTMLMSLLALYIFLVPEGQKAHLSRWVSGKPAFRSLSDAAQGIDVSIDTPGKIRLGSGVDDPIILADAFNVPADVLELLDSFRNVSLGHQDIHLPHDVHQGVLQAAVPLFEDIGREADDLSFNPVPEMRLVYVHQLKQFPAIGAAGCREIEGAVDVGQVAGIGGWRAGIHILGHQGAVRGAVALVEIA
jgi:hypothetical protein